MIKYQDYLRSFARDQITLPSSSIPITLVPTFVVISPIQVILISGTLQQLTVTTTDQFLNPVTGSSYTYVSNNTSIFTISSGGLIRGNVTGSAVATITDTVYNLSASVVVNIPSNVTSISISPLTPSIVSGSSQMFLIKDQFINILTGGAFMSSDPTNGPISSGGVFSPKLSGSYTITADYFNGVSHLTASTTATVLPYGSVASIAISPSSATASGSQIIQFTGTAHDSLNNVVPGVSFTWAMQSGGSTVGTVNSSGLFTANATLTGSDYVVISSGGFHTSASVTTFAGYTLTATPSPISFNVGDTRQFVVMENGIDVTNDVNTIYSSSNPSIVIVTNVTASISNAIISGLFGVSVTTNIGNLSISAGTQTFNSSSGQFIMGSTGPAPIIFDDATMYSSDTDWKTKTWSSAVDANGSKAAITGRGNNIGVSPTSAGTIYTDGRNPILARWSSSPTQTFKSNNFDPGFDEPTFEYMIEGSNFPQESNTPEGFHYGLSPFTSSVLVVERAYQPDFDSSGETGPTGTHATGDAHIYNVGGTTSSGSVITDMQSPGFKSGPYVMQSTGREGAQAAHWYVGNEITSLEAYNGADNAIPETNFTLPHVIDGTLWIWEFRDERWVSTLDNRLYHAVELCFKKKGTSTWYLAQRFIGSYAPGEAIAPWIAVDPGMKNCNQSRALDAHLMWWMTRWALWNADVNNDPMGSRQYFQSVPAPTPTAHTVASYNSVTGVMISNVTFDIPIAKLRPYVNGTPQSSQDYIIPNDLKGRTAYLNSGQILPIATITLTGINPGDTISWHGINGSGTVESTGSPSITTPSVAGQPTLGDSSGVTTSTLIFPVTLNASGALPTSIVVRYSTDGGSTWGSVVNESIPGTPSLGQNFNLTISALTSSTTYSVQVAEYNAAGTGSWSVIKTASTSTTDSPIYTVISDNNQAYLFDSSTGATVSDLLNNFIKGGNSVAVTSGYDGPGNQVIDQSFVSDYIVVSDPNVGQVLRYTNGSIRGWSIWAYPTASRGVRLRTLLQYNGSTSSSWNGATLINTTLAGGSNANLTMQSNGNSQYLLTGDGISSYTDLGYGVGLAWAAGWEDTIWDMWLDSNNKLNVEMTIGPLGSSRTSFGILMSAAPVSTPTSSSITKVELRNNGGSATSIDLRLIEVGPCLDITGSRLPFPAFIAIGSSVQSTTAFPSYVYATTNVGNVTVTAITSSSTYFTNGYSYRKLITQDHTKVGGSSSLSNFPVLVSLTDSALATTTNSGHVQSATGLDIRFEDVSGTKLDHEVESWSATTGNIITWVRIPTLSYSTDTSFYLYYGNAAVSASEQNTTGVWDGNYDVVLHMNDNVTNTKVIDSTTHDRLSLAAQTTDGLSTTVEIGKGLSFNGSSDNVQITRGSDFLLATAPCTVEFWIKDDTSASTLAAYHRIISMYDGTYNFQIGIAESLTSTRCVYALVKVPAASATHSADVASSGDLSSGLHHVQLISDGAGTYTLLVDGVSTSGGSPLYSVGVQTVDTTHVFIGQRGDGTSWVNGVMDEVRFSNVARSVGYGITNYNNQFSPSTFLSLGAEQASGIISGSSSGSYAWNSIGPLSESIFSDWPTNTYANATAFQTAGGSNKFSFDNINQIDGNSSLLHTVTAISTSYAYRGIGPFTPVDDQVVHFRTNFYHTPVYGQYDSAQPINAIYNAGADTQAPFDVAIFGLGFNSTSYKGPGWAYYTPPSASFTQLPTSGIIIQHSQGNLGMQYRLSVSLFNTTPTVLATSAFNVPLQFIGDEWYDPDFHIDFFIRTYRSGTHSETLNVEVYAGHVDEAPVLVGNVSVTMLDTTQAFPLPLRAVWDIGHKGDGFTSFGTDWNTRYGWMQVIDNGVHPNIALDFVHTTSSTDVGLGRYGKYGSPQIIPLDLMANTAELIAQRDVHCSLRNTGVGLIDADVLHEGHKSARMFQAQYSLETSTGVQVDGMHSRARAQSEFWTGETLLFSDQWTNMGAGQTNTPLTVDVTASASPQEVSVLSASVFDTRYGTIDGSAGVGTANYETIYITAANTSSNTITAIFGQNHASGSSIRQAAGPGYKLFMGGTNIGLSVQIRLELVATSYETYLLNNESSFDNTQPAFMNNGVVVVDPNGLYRVFVPPSGTAMDVISTPVGNSQRFTPTGTRYGQNKPLRMYTHGTLFRDDNGQSHIRAEMYWVSSDGTPQFFNLTEAAIVPTVYPVTGSLGWTNIHFGENFNELILQSQSLDRYGVPLPASLGGGFSTGQVIVNPQDPNIGADPFNIMALFGVSQGAAPILGITKNIGSNQFTIPVSASASYAPIQLLVDRFNSGSWTYDSVITWPSGSGASQDIILTGLYGSTNYSGSIRFRFVDSFGPGHTTIINNGTTSIAAPPYIPASVTISVEAGTSLVYTVTSAAAGGLPTSVIASVDENGTGTWVDQTAISWTFGLDASTTIAVTGLTGNKDYTGKIKIRLVNTDGASSSYVVTSGSTTIAPTAFPLSHVYRLKPGYGQDTYTDGAAVGTITDVAGGIIMQQTGSSTFKPIFISSSMGGKSALQFNSTQSLISTNNITALHGNDLWELVVMRIDGFPNSSGALISRYQPNTTPIQGMYYSTVGFSGGSPFYDIQMSQGSASVNYGGSASPTFSTSGSDFGYLLFAYDSPSGYSHRYWNGVGANFLDPMGSDFGTGTQMAINRRIETGSIGATFTLLEHVIGHGASPNQTTIHTYLQSEYGFV